MSEINYSLKEPFDIDAGELDGIPPQFVFTMGVEWYMVSAELDAGAPITRTIHSENRERIQRMCIRRGRKCKITDTKVPGWHYLEVA